MRAVFRVLSRVLGRTSAAEPAPAPPKPQDHEALAGITARRAGPDAFDGDELRKRITDFGEIRLDDAHRHDAFREVYDALTPVGFRFMPFPNESGLFPADDRIRIKAVVVDVVSGQVVAEIVRDFLLRQGFVDHELMRIQKPYRNLGLSHVLLNQALPLYRQLGLNLVVIHAALSTGRWHWARMGFDFLPGDRGREPIERWAGLCFAAVGENVLAPNFPPSRLATFGTEPGGHTISLEALRQAVEAALPTLTGTGVPRPVAAIVTALIADCDERARLESDGAWSGCLDPDRISYIAEENRLKPGADVPLGKATMLIGPDWHGYFDLHDLIAQQVFDAEFSRRFSSKG